MNDSLNHQLQGLAGIPDTGTRLTIAVVITFIFIILIVLLYFKMIEEDEKLED